MFGQHMTLRWWQRGGRENPTIEEAWEEGIDVSLPGRPGIEAKLHRGTGTVIARKSRGGGTILNSKNMVLYKGSNLICGNCMSTLRNDHRCPNSECI